MTAPVSATTGGRSAAARRRRRRSSQSNLVSSLFLILLVASCLPPTVMGGLGSFFGGGGGNDGSEKKDSPSSSTITTPENNNNNDDEPVDYGVDVSFPIHHAQVSTNYPWLPHHTSASEPMPDQYKDMVIQPLGDRQRAYNELIQGCHAKYRGREQLCDSTERDRIAMNKRQPQSMQNYTDLGFKKIRAPESLFNLLTEFWNKNHDTRKDERWNAGNTYTNHWTSPTYMVSVEDVGLRGGGSALKQKIWNAARDAIEEWTGQELTACSLYGIRVYEEGAVLAPHVDRLPLVSSAIINVAQDVDEPWPIEVYAHDGKAYNVSMEPGDMVLYESHSVVHGRPFPLKGRFYANVFIHFEPIGHSLRHNAGTGKAATTEDVHEKYKKTVAEGVGGHEGHTETGLPPYVIEGTPEATKWKREHPGGWNKQKDTTFETGSTEAHHAAQIGNLDGLKKVAQKKKDLLVKEDKNGWQPIHEGTRGGHVEVVKFLVENGADPNKRTNWGSGGSPLWWAKQSHGAKHPVVAFLESIGATEIGPEL